MAMRLEAFGGCRGVLQTFDPARGFRGNEAAAAPALLRSLGFEKVAVVFEQPSAR